MAKKTTKKQNIRSADSDSGRSTSKTAAKATETTTKVADKPKKGAKTTKKRTRRPATTKTNGTAASNGHAQPTIEAPDNLVVDEPRYGPLGEAELRKVKTGLTKRDLASFRKMLLEKRAELVGDVEGLEMARSGSGDVSHMPLHMADIGSDHYDQEFNLGLMESEKRLLAEIDESLLRIQNGTYGVCLESGKPIPKARLEIKPWAKYTIEVVKDRERRGIH